MAVIWGILIKYNGQKRSICASPAWSAHNPPPLFTQLQETHPGHYISEPLQKVIRLEKWTNGVHNTAVNPENLSVRLQCNHTQSDCI